MAEQRDADVIQVHVLADSTGDTAARVARAACAQYAGFHTRIVRHARLSSADGVRGVLQRIDQESRAVVFSTIMQQDLREFVRQVCDERGIPHAELLDDAVAALSQATGAAPELTVRPVGVGEDYFARIQAMEFSIANDDGKLHHPLRDADVVLIGVSRTGKTPLAMYLGYLGYRTANIPLVPGIAPPDELYDVERHKIVGLTIDPERLHAIRSRRVTAMGSPSDQAGYADLSRIFSELEEIAGVQRSLGCPVIDTTQLALEEAAGRVIEVLERRSARARRRTPR
ncbi:MAG TPA: pyruvate, water dikinase regulatory protein [Ornithinimicrobium sp.]|uniref:pyruvate, water dikinase regulatory protein n=1 Tax=Ornithinimicrobium sp. TaxID=1977084 RepID=UPI002B463898|nr:pyruvate, water dikinase regulatory protein [Ornithinimicrobium sp.]HKJ12580.1 pyruvate, water dikinase regulatory protein [Ornithinimicrobium sp.]